MRNFAKKALPLLVIGLFTTSCDTRQDRIAAAEGKGWLAESNYDEGNYARAVMLAREAVTELTPLIGSDDPRTIHWRYELGEFLRAAGRYEEAIAEDRIVVATATRALGVTHEDTLYARIRLASALREVNNAEGNMDTTKGREAEEICNSALKLAEKEYGRESDVAMNARQGLAVICGNRGDFEESARHSTILLEIRRLKLGNEDARTLSTRMNLASTLLAQKLFEPAQREFQTVYEIRKKTLGEDHPDTIQAEDWIGACFADQKRFAEALPIQRDVWTRKKKVLGETHRGSLVAGFNLATSEVDAGNREESKRILREIYQLALKNFGPEDSQTQMYQQAIAVVK